MTVPLEAAQHHSDYTMAGHPFDLTQRIGDPGTGAGDLFTIACGAAEVMAGFRLDQDSDGRVTGLWAKCMDAP